MKVINTHKTALKLSDGTELIPGVPTPVFNWDTLKNNAVIKAWLKARVLKETPDDGDEVATIELESESAGEKELEEVIEDSEQDEQAAQDDPAPVASNVEEMSKADVMDALDERGVSYNKRNNVGILRELLTETLAAE